MLMSAALPPLHTSTRSAAAARYSASAFASYRDSLPAGVADGLQVEFNDFGFPRRLYRRGGALTSPAAGDLVGAGLYQFVLKIPTASGAGNLPVVAWIAGESTAPGPYITVSIADQ